MDRLLIYGSARLGKERGSMATPFLFCLVQFRSISLSLWPSGLWMMHCLSGDLQKWDTHHPSVSQSAAHHTIESASEKLLPEVV